MLRLFLGVVVLPKPSYGIEAISDGRINEVEGPICNCQLPGHSNGVLPGVLPVTTHSDKSAIG
jgi:hypothetical protein